MIDRSDSCTAGRHDWCSGAGCDCSCHEPPGDALVPALVPSSPSPRSADERLPEPV